MTGRINRGGRRCADVHFKVSSASSRLILFLSDPGDVWQLSETSIRQSPPTLHAPTPPRGQTESTPRPSGSPPHHASAETPRSTCDPAPTAAAITATRYCAGTPPPAAATNGSAADIRTGTVSADPADRSPDAPSPPLPPAQIPAPPYPAAPQTPRSPGTHDPPESTPPASPETASLARDLLPE